jgi:hypothetical protein
MNVNKESINIEWNSWVFLKCSIFFYLTMWSVEELSLITKRMCQNVERKYSAVSRALKTKTLNLTACSS